MNRREFLKWFGLAIAGLFVPKGKEPESEKQVFDNSLIDDDFAQHVKFTEPEKSLGVAPLDEYHRRYLQAMAEWEHDIICGTMDDQVDDDDFAQDIKLAYDRLSLEYADLAGIDTKPLSAVFHKHAGWWESDGYGAYEKEFRETLKVELLRQLNIDLDDYI